ncbi:MAG: membrane dipeptidase [Planctomycetes bacterium]|nr:membrane dipeptidase [Planctomycetota bacterium]
MLIIDSHLDLAYNAIEYNRDILQPVAAIRASEAGMKDKKGRGSNTVAIPAMREAGIGLSFVTVHARVASVGGRFAGVRNQDIAYAKAQGEAAVYRLLERKGVMRMVHDRASLEAHLLDWQGDPSGTPLGFVLSMEGADPIVSPEQVPDWWRQGLRIVSLVHYGISTYAHGTQAPGGLLPPARPLLKALEAQGMVLDLTHTAEGSFWEALDLFGGPVIATHNCCHALVPHDRQFTDRQIRSLVERDAVIGVAFDDWMLTPDFDKLKPDNSRTTLGTVTDHIDHICQVAGNVRHAAIGTDLDGGYGREQSPCDLDTIADLRRIPGILEKRGYPREDIAAVMHGNWLTFLRRVWPG